MQHYLHRSLLSLCAIIIVSVAFPQMAHASAKKDGVIILPASAAAATRPIPNLEFTAQGSPVFVANHAFQDLIIRNRLGQDVTMTQINAGDEYGKIFCGVMNHQSINCWKPRGLQWDQEAVAQAQLNTIDQTVHRRFAVGNGFVIAIDDSNTALFYAYQGNGNWDPAVAVGPVNEALEVAADGNIFCLNSGPTDLRLSGSQWTMACYDAQQPTQPLSSAPINASVGMAVAADAGEVYITHGAYGVFVEYSGWIYGRPVTNLTTSRTVFGMQMAHSYDQYSDVAASGSTVCATNSFGIGGQRGSELICSGTVQGAWADQSHYGVNVNPTTGENIVGYKDWTTRSFVFLQ